MGVCEARNKRENQKRDLPAFLRPLGRCACVSCSLHRVDTLP